MKIKRNLNAWKNIVVKVVTDEDIEDMSWAAVIEDRGDEYLVVKMKDGRAYKYGCFANLKNSSYYLSKLVKQPELFKPLDNLSSYFSELVKQPEVFKSPDSDTNPVQEICGLIYRYVFEKGYNGILSCEKIVETPLAQHDFYCLINELDEIFKTSDRQYFCDSYKDYVKLFLEVNGIATEENLAKLESAHWNSRVDGIDGYAGKEELDPDDAVYFDSLIDTYIVDKNDLEYVRGDDCDEWGEYGYYLHLSPDPVLNANKKLFVAVAKSRDWYDEYNNEGFESKDKKHFFVLDKTFVNDLCEAFYLVITKDPIRPRAAYMTLDEVLKEVKR